MSLVVSGHQPDLLPYSGFWWKLAHSDLLDLKIYDQFVASGYQKRVRMRGQWANIPISSKVSATAPIIDQHIDPVVAPRTLAKMIYGRYSGAKYWRTRGTVIHDLVLSIHTDRLWQFNLELILGVRDLLGIKTPIGIAPPTRGKGSDGIIDGLRRYGPDVTYLSGIGGKAYMGDCAEFHEAGIDVVWSRHQAVTGDSIVSVIVDYDDPMEMIMREDEIEENIA